MWMFKRLVLPMVILLVVLGIWEAIVFFKDTPHYILPPPSKIVVTLFTEHEQLLKHSLVTLQEMLFGFTLAISIGLSLIHI